MLFMNEIIYKCPWCGHFREKTALDFDFECPIHGLRLRKVGTLLDLKQYYDSYRADSP